MIHASVERGGSRFPLVATLVVAAGAAVAFVLWTLPNWQVFSRAVGEFATLWQIPANRRVMVVLVVKICSPLEVALLLAGYAWLWSTLKPYALQWATTFRPDSTSTLPISALPHSWETPGRRPFVRTAGQGHHPFVGSQAQGRPAFPTWPRQASSSMQAVRTPMHEPGAPTPHATLSLPITPVPEAEARDERGQADPQPQAENGEQGLHQVADVVEVAGAAPQDEVSDVCGPSAVEAGEQGTPGEQASLTVTASESAPLITITLLKAVSMTLHAPGGLSRDISFQFNNRRVQLLAYIACQRGQKVHRDRIVEEVFGHGKPDEQASPQQLTDAFDSHRKFLRTDLRRATRALNQQAGEQVLPLDLSLFANGHELWWLADGVKALDLDAVETEHRVIEQARRGGLLSARIPDFVKAACDRLLAAYTGDFLQDLLTQSPGDFDPWVSSWARKPFTLYRDCYLQALWYSAEYELQAGRTLASQNVGGASEGARQHEQYSRAAQHYSRYAERAVDNRFDTKLTFGKAGREPGERVIMSERALRRCLMLYGILGSTDLVDQTYASYARHMKRISSEAWQPSPQTLSDLQEARSRTSAYRLPAQTVTHEVGLPPLERADH